MEPDKIEVIAQTIVDSVLNGEDYSPLSESLQAIALNDAYAIQSEVYIRLGTQANLGELAGHKIALTSKAIQEMCGVTQPLYGSIFRSQIHSSPARVKIGNYGRLGLEFEVAVRIEHAVPLPQNLSTGYNAESIAEFVGACMPAFELIDDRNADYSQLDAISILTDRCWCAGTVLGNPQTDWRSLNLSECPVELIVNGQSTATAVTGDSMGHPFNGLAWVANHLAITGQQLLPGDIVITGSALKTCVPRAGESYVYRIEGLGEVALEIE